MEFCEILCFYVVYTLVDQRWFWRRKGSGGDCYVCNGRGADLCSEGHWTEVNIPLGNPSSYGNPYYIV